MTSYPLPTLGPTIDSTGISAPSFADILASLKVSYQTIYGSDTNVDDDTQDGQFLGLIASAINDTNAATISAFNARSPSSAQGAGLSSVVKLNGLEREAQSNSVAAVLITGVTGTTLTGCVIGDDQGLGTQWSIPDFTVIGDGGTVTVAATCTTPGAITAAPGTLSVIVTPTLGWQLVSNPDSAAPGVPVENDPTLRQRQAVSQNQAAQSPVAATLGAILQLPTVTRATYDENTGSGADGNGVPGHSVAFIVEGGDPQQIANTIALDITTGSGTYGTTTETVIDPGANPIDINFFVLDLTPITVVVTLTALVGYADTTGVLIQAAVAAYISTLPIGAIVYLNKVEAIASLMSSPLNSTFEIPDGGITLNGDVANVVIDFNKAAFCETSDVSIIVGL